MKIDGQTKYYSEDSDFTTDNIGNATEITLLKDVTAPQDADVTASKVPTPGVVLSKSCTLDLNGKTLTFNSAIGIQVADGESADAKNTFTLKDGESNDSGGKIICTWDPNTANTLESTGRTLYYKKISGNKCYAAINVGTLYGNSSNRNVPSSKTETTDSNVVFIMDGGTIESKSTAICASDATITINKGTVQSIKACGVYFGHMGKGGGTLTLSNGGQIISGSNLTANDLTVALYKSTFTDKANTVTGDTLTDEQKAELAEELYSEMPAIQVSGNLSTTPVTINIQSGAVKYNKPFEYIEKDSNNAPNGDPTAIYSSGNAKLNISGGDITSTGTGVEFRLGELEVTGGNITSTAPEYAVTNETKTSGSSTFGSAIAVAQKSATESITVRISGNETNIAGPNAFVAANPKSFTSSGNNTGKVTATIDGGKFISTQTSSSSRVGNAVLADNTNVVITVNSGKLNGDVTVNKNAGAESKTNESTIIVAGGEATGKVQVVKTNSSGESIEQESDDSLKVMGTAKITNVESAKKYVAAGYTIKDDGTTEESSDNGWKLRGTASLSTSYDFILAGSPSQSLISASGVGKNALLKYDRTNRLIGIANGIGYSLDSADSVLGGDVKNLKKKGYYLANFSISGGAVSIRPLTEDVRITGTGFIDSKIVTLTTYDDAAASLGIVVDATDNKLANISGGAGKDSIKAGARNTTLDGGANDDTLEGGSGDDLFIYTAGNDVIANYTHGTDTVSLSAGTAPVDFGNVNFDGTNLDVTVNGAGNVLTFKSATDGSVTKDGIVYTYQGHAGGGMNYIAIDKSDEKPEHGISLGSAYNEARFNGTTAAHENYATIDAAKVTGAIRIIGNDNPNYIVGGIGGGTLEGGEGNDTLMASTGSTNSASLTLNGGDGDDSLIGGNGYNVFVYTEGSDSISGYKAGNLVTVRGSGIDFENAGFSSSGKNIMLDFGGSDSLTFVDGADVASGISVQSGRNTYVYKQNSIARNNDAITLTSEFADSIFGPDIYDTVNAVAVGKAISIVGNDNNNVIFGSSLGGGLFGGKGNDKLDVTERKTDESPAEFVFQYTEGKDTVSGFVASNDKLEITATRIGQISKAKSSKGDTRLAFTFDKSNVLTFTNEDEVNSVSLNSGGFLTKDGVVSIPASGGDNSFTLFERARGRVDLTEAPYAGTEIKEVNAENVKKQSVTLVGASVDGGSQYTFTTNKKKDLFEYNGGDVTISGYEAGKDRLDLNTAALSTFSVSGGNVSLTTGLGTVVLEGMKEKEVLLHHAESKRNSFTKMVFKDTGVILNKEKRPTAATVSGNYNASADTTVKKIFVADGADNISITAGDRNKTTLDASAANGISLIGGAKNDKLIGSTSTVAADTFIYAKGGKDIIQNYSSNDQISLGDFASSLTSAKINAGKRSIKFKFSNKNALTVKPTKGSTLDGALNISGLEGYTYAKNAIVSLGSGASGGNASLTSEFNGSYRLKDSGVNNVDGSRVEKNLTYRGTSADETLSGGTKKTTFKGGGGKDSLKGGSGNDIFFYAKGDTGNTTIADFDYTKDKLKIASGTITKISKSEDGEIKFDMNNGRKNSANIGSFKINSSATYTGVNKTQGNFDPNSTLIKANNTYYWFAEKGGTDASGESYAQGALITTVSKVSKSQVSDYAVIDLGYSSNLVNAGVATKVSDTFEKLKPTSSNSGGGTN